MTPMTLVQIYVEVPIVGANIRAATNSNVISPNPVINAIASSLPIRRIHLTIPYALVEYGILETMKQKHIVIEARNLPTSTGRYVEMLVRYLEKVDTVNRYSILMYPDKMDAWTPTNPNFTAVPCKYKEYSFAEQLGFAWQLYRLKPDLVHFSMPQQPILYFGKVVTTIQDLTTARYQNPDKNPTIFRIKQHVYKWLIKYVSHKSTLLIAISDFVRHDIADYAKVSLDKITVTHEAVDDFDAPAEEMPFFVGKRFIMGDGRARPHKNLERQIEAFAKLHKENPDIYFMLTGKQGPTGDVFKQRLKDMGLADHVILTGFISDGQLKWAMQHCEAYVWASLSEGFGLPPLEAMLNGAPVISSNASCMPEVLGDAVEYFDPYSVDDMAWTMHLITTDTKLQKKLRKKGKEHIKQYSWQRMAEQTLAVYNDALGVKN